MYSRKAWLLGSLLTIGLCSAPPYWAQAGNEGGTAVATPATSDAVLDLLAKYVAPRIEPAQLVSKVEGRQSLHKAIGTGWCLNRECDWVITNFHILKVMGGHASVNGVAVTQIALATSDHDKGAQPVATVFGTLQFTPVRDIALVKVREPLSRAGMHAVPFYTGNLRRGQAVTVVGYPGGKLAAISGKFVEECDEGELRFDLSQEVAPGISGGLVLDAQGRAIGLVYGMSPDSGKTIFAVPVWSVAEFLRVVSPVVYASVFGDADGTSDTGIAMLAPGRGEQISNPALSEPRSNEPTNTRVAPGEETPIVKALRNSAQEASGQMDNFVARQTLHFSTGDAWQHELQLVNGAQQFRSLGNGKDIRDLPITRRGPVPGAEWSDLVTTIGFDDSVGVRFARDMTVEGKTVKVFQYEVSGGDEICQLRVSRPMRRQWKGSPPSCGGVIWTDENFRILRITKEMSLFPQEAGGVATFRIVVLYGAWGERLVPVEMHLQSTLRNGTIQESVAKFDDYREFQASSRITF
jgi:hypothetical protein